MRQVNILEARNNLSRLVSAARAGEEVVIAHRGTPVVKLVSAGADVPQHTAAQAAAWLSEHRVPRPAVRSASELDEQIAAEREGWE